MAPAYKLTYFDARGRGEPVRLLFAYGGIKYEDVRISKEDWPKLKPKTPYEQIPILEHEGKVLNQSMAIARYVARKVKLYGQDDWEDAEIDAMLENFNDLIKPFTSVFQITDPEAAKAKLEELAKTTLPFFLERFEKSTKSHGGFLASKRITLADIVFADISDKIISRVGPDALAKYPTLAALNQKVLAIPNIKKWVETRPKTEH